MTRTAPRSALQADRRRWKVRTVLALAVVAALGAGVWYAARSWQQSEDRSAALELSNRQRWDDALPALLKCLERDPGDADVLAAVVVTLVHSHAAATEVEPYLNRLIATRPDDVDALVIRLDMLKKFGRYEEALADAEHLLVLRPDDYRTRDSAATLAAALGRHEEAERHLTELLNSSPYSKADLGTRLAQSRHDRGDRAGAEAALTQYVPPGADHPPAQVLRGILLYDAGQYDEAAALLRAVAPNAGPARRDALYHLALALDRTGKPDEARQTFDLLDREYRLYRVVSDANQRQDDLPSQMRAARAKLDAGEAKEAVQLLESAMTRLGPDRDAYRLLADAYDRIGRPDLAATARRQADSMTAPPAPPSTPPR